MFEELKFNDLIRIRQLQDDKPKQLSLRERNKNFKEFTDVYKEVLRHPGLAKQRQSNGSVSRPLHTVKKIYIEMPVLGNEQAIVPVSKKVQKTTPSKAPVRSTRSIVQEAEESILLDDAELFLKQTKYEIDESEAQLEALKTFITTIKPPSTKIKKPKTPTYKARRRPDRHHECINRRYMTTLNTMHEKLRRLEEKYFSKPHVIYKNVKDICTEYSEDNLLESKSSEETNVEETLSEIKHELESIASSSNDNGDMKTKSKTVTFKVPEVELHTVGDTLDEEKTAQPTNFSFKTPRETNEEQECYAKIIDRSENWLKKYKQYIDCLDVEKLCDGIANIGTETDDEAEETRPKEETRDRSIGDDSDAESHDSDFDRFYHDNPSYLTKDLQGAITCSAFLSKEFDNMKPNVKVFNGASDRYVTSKYLDLAPKKSHTSETSVTDLINNLNLSLKDSIYKPATSIAYPCDRRGISAAVDNPLNSSCYESSGDDDYKVYQTHNS